MFDQSTAFNDAVLRFCQATLSEVDAFGAFDRHAKYIDRL